MKQKIPYFLLFVLFQHLNWAQQTSVLEVETYQLENGFTVMLNRDTTATKIYGGVVVNAGAKDEDPNYTGTAHYLEHLLFKGTDRLGTADYEKEKVFLERINELYDQLSNESDPTKKLAIQKEINDNAVKASEYGLPTEFKKLLGNIGSTGINAFTRYDMTFYHNAFPTHELNRWLDIYAERFRKPVFRNFQSELEVVYEEKNRAMDDMERKVGEAVQKRIFPNLPYGQWSVLGTIDNLKNPNINDTYDFYNNYYVANNMALVLTGNFEINTAKELVAKKFSQLPRREVTRPELEELTPIEGLVTDKVRLTPVKAAFRGYQTVPVTHPDRIALDVAEYLLSNDSQTGLIDELMGDNKLLYSGAFSMPFNEAGGFVVFTVPKILFQSLGKARKMVDEHMATLRNGEIDPIRMEIAKRELIQSFQRRSEGLYGRAIMIAEAYNLRISWERYQQYDDLISKVTLADVQEVSQKYFGENMVRIVSRTGFGKGEKLPKPPYKAVATDQKASSQYAEAFAEMEVVPFTPKFIDLEKDVKTRLWEGGHKLVAANNPISDRYQLAISFQVGTKQYPDLRLVSAVLDHVGIQTNDGVLDAKTFQKQLAALGSRIFTSASHNEFTVTLSGTSETFDQSFDFFVRLLTDPKPDDFTGKVTKSKILADRKLDRNRASTMGRAVFEYAVYGEESVYKDRHSKNEIKGADLGQSLQKWHEVLRNYSTTITYFGTQSADGLQQKISGQLPLTSEERSVSPEQQQPRELSQTEFILVNNKKLNQSQIYIFLPGESPRKEEYYQRNAFNDYFAGGFTGLMKQEIREFRSLAYSTGGNAIVAITPEGKNRFYGFIGCQSDKTNDAIDVMMGLIQNMPEKPERVSSLASSLKQSVVTSYPEFTALADQVVELQEKGYSQDPNRAAFEAYDDLTMEDILAYYQRHHEGKPIAISIYGDLRKLDREALAKYGKVKEMKLKEAVTF